MLQVWPIEVFADNYVWVIEREGCSRVAIVDPGDAAPVLAALDGHDLEVASVLVTHHHADHVGGLERVVARYRPAVFGSDGDDLPGVTHPIGCNDAFALPGPDLEIAVAALPGHTLNHLGYLGNGLAFVGDTLFAGGCGRVFEGTMEQMHRSLQRLATLPSATKIYCAHEYTTANLRFGLQVEPGNEALTERLGAVEETRRAGMPTIPSTLGLELETNVFLRCDEPEVVEAASSHAGRQLAAGAPVFGVLRSWKDGWQG